jgi:hypothetical protein
VYFGFQGFDAFGLSQKTGTAVVIGKEHLPAKRTYRTDYIAGHTRVVPQVTPDLHVWDLRIGDNKTSTAVEPSLFETISNGDRVAVTYQQRRLTGKLQVTSVRREVR